MPQPYLHFSKLLLNIKVLQSTLCAFTVTLAGSEEQPWKNQRRHDALILPPPHNPTMSGHCRRKQMTLLTLKHPTEAQALVKELLEEAQRAHGSACPLPALHFSGGSGMLFCCYLSYPLPLTSTYERSAASSPSGAAQGPLCFPPSAERG